MKITDLLKKQSICLDGKADSKEQVIREMVDLMAEGGNINDIDTYRETVFKREEEGTTGIGEGIAIPHGKTEAVSAPGLAAMVLPEGVDYDSLDGEPAYLIFLIAAPNTEDNVHLEVLSRLSMLLMDEDFRNKLLHAKDVDEFLAYVDVAEKEKFPEEAEEKAEAPADASAKPYQILAVTACPTGIAHTYMAAEGLEKKAKEMGVTIKVETNGSGGAKNVLTPEEIAACDCIIIAADKDVAMARFDGKPLISTKVSDGINKAQELIERALSGNAPVYHSKGGATEEGGASADGDTIGRKIYKSLMNGVSHMLPFVIGGGILIALSFLVDGANAGTAAFGSGTPLAKFFNIVGNTAFGMMFPILAGYIAMAIGDRPALMPGIVGGLLAKAGTSVFLAEDAWISSGFFGALIAGFAAGYLMIGLKKLFDKLPKTLEGTKPVLLYPFFGILIMAAFMIFIVNPPVGAFNTWLNNVLSGMGESSKMLLGAVLAGMMSIGASGIDMNMGSLVGCAICIMTGADIETALTVAVPMTLLCTLLNTISSVIRIRFTHMCDEAVDKGDFAKAKRVDIVYGPVLYVLFTIIPVFLSVYFGADVVQSIASSVPTWLTKGISLGANIIAFYGFAMLLSTMVNRNTVVYFFAGFLLAAYSGLGLTAIALIGIVIAVVLYTVKYTGSGANAAPQSVDSTLDDLEDLDN